MVLYIAHSELTMEKKEHLLSDKIMMKIKKLQQLKQLFVEMKKELDEVNKPVSTVSAMSPVSAVPSQCSETSEEGLEEGDEDKIGDGSRAAIAFKLEDGNNEAALEIDCFAGVEKVYDNSLMRTVPGEDSSRKIGMNEDTEDVCPLGPHQKSVTRAKTAIGDVTPLKIMCWLFDSGGGNLN